MCLCSLSHMKTPIWSALIKTRRSILFTCASRKRNTQKKIDPVLIDLLCVSGTAEPSASPAKDNYRMNRYKNKALNPEEMRRRREEEGIQLRKQKREQQVPRNGESRRARGCFFAVIVVVVFWFFFSSSMCHDALSSSKSSSRGETSTF